MADNAECEPLQDAGEGELKASIWAPTDTRESGSGGDEAASGGEDEAASGEGESASDDGGGAASSEDEPASGDGGGAASGEDEPAGGGGAASIEGEVAGADGAVGDGGAATSSDEGAEDSGGSEGSRTPLAGSPPAEPLAVRRSSERDFKILRDALASQKRPSSLRLGSKMRGPLCGSGGESREAEEGRENHKVLLDALVEHVDDLRAGRVKSLDAGGYLQDFLELARLIRRIGYPRIYDEGDRTMPYYGEVSELSPCAHPDLAGAIKETVSAWRAWNAEPELAEPREEFARALRQVERVIEALTERALADLDGGTLEAALGLMAEMHRVGYPRIHNGRGRTLLDLYTDIATANREGLYDEVLRALLEKTRAAWGDWCAEV